MIGYEIVTSALETARGIALAQGWGGAAESARLTMDAVLWSAPEIRREMVRRYLAEARARVQMPDDVPARFYAFLAAALRVSLVEVW